MHRYNALLSSQEDRFSSVIFVLKEKVLVCFHEIACYDFFFSSCKEREIVMLWFISTKSCYFVISCDFGASQEVNSSSCCLYVCVFYKDDTLNFPI